MLSVERFFVNSLGKMKNEITRKQEPWLLYGLHAIREKLRAQASDVLEILIAQDAVKAARDLTDEAEKRGVRVTTVRRAILDRLARGQRHQGAVAKIKPHDYGNIEDLLDEVATADWSGSVIALDGLTDPHNFGAILRTAEAVGVKHIVIPRDRSVEVTPIVSKTSAGAVHHLKVHKVTNLRRALEGLKERGFWTVGLCAGISESIFDRVYPPKLCLVLGSEGEGIRPLIRQECDFLVAIPMLGKVASLNVSVAAAVFLYEVLRQRRTIAAAQTASKNRGLPSY